MGSIRRVPADHADREVLRDELRYRQELRDRIERHSSIILVQTRDDDSLSRVRERLADLNDVRSEELNLIDSDDLEGLSFVKNFSRGLHRDGFEAPLIVTDDVLGGVSVVDLGFEENHRLSRNLGSSNPADELLGLSGKHASADHFDPAGISGRGMNHEAG